MHAVLSDIDGTLLESDALWDERACRELGWRFRPVGARLQGIREYSTNTVPEVWPGLGAPAALGQGG